MKPLNWHFLESPITVRTVAESLYGKKIEFSICRGENRFITVNWQRNQPYRNWTT